MGIVKETNKTIFEGKVKLKWTLRAIFVKTQALFLSGRKASITEQILILTANK